MIIVLCREVLFRPHRHANKTESFHVIEGEFDMIVFDDDGQPKRVILMGSPESGRIYCYRLCTNAWHTLLPRSDIAVYHEVTTGPFDPGQPAEFAPWAPTEPKALRRFLESSVKLASG
jgi:cupin fold WbuC family metalloprotein